MTPARLPAGRLVVWGGFALALLLAPQLFPGRLALTMLSQFGYVAIMCLSYNLLFGQGGMVSFGHAVYTGLGAFCAIHAMNLAGHGGLPVPLPLPLVPLVGGAAGCLVAALLGYPSTRKAGTPFAMITLGVGELVYAMSLMFPAFFGGEAGVSANRVYGAPWLGLSFGPQIQVYYLIAFYCFACTAVMFAFTRTPLGRMLNAVRDNPERVEYIGYSTRQVRYLAFMISGFFAGIGGALAAINFEIVSAEVVGFTRSSSLLLFTFLGGAGFFFGPLLGAALLVLGFVLLSQYTSAWQLYLGLVFTLMVIFAPGGFASLLANHWQWPALRRQRAPLAACLALGATALTAFSGLAVMIEIVYRMQLERGAAQSVRVFGMQLSTTGADAWVGSMLTMLTGGLLFELVRRSFKRQCNSVQDEMESQGLRPDVRHEAPR